MGNNRKIALIACVIGLGSGVQADCAADRVSIFGDFGRAHFAVDVADDDQERGRGLMDVADMAAMSGMLFAYDDPRAVSFWMRNTLIPLDMIFAGADGTITRIHSNAIPMDETVIDGGRGIQFVLEINGGMAARLGLNAGDVLQHPLIVTDAKRPCE